MIQDCSMVLDSRVKGKECWPIKKHVLCFKCNRKRQDESEPESEEEWVITHLRNVWSPGISVWVIVSTLRKSELTYLVREKTLYSDTGWNILRSGKEKYFSFLCPVYCYVLSVASQSVQQECRLLILTSLSSWQQPKVLQALTVNM